MEFVGTSDFRFAPDTAEADSFNPFNLAIANHADGDGRQIVPLANRFEQFAQSATDLVI
jgi:hypothetical protein